MPVDRKYSMCPGGSCPFRDVCKRYDPDLDKKKKRVYHFNKPPFKQNGIDVDCEFYDNKDGEIYLERFDGRRPKWKK